MCVRLPQALLALEPGQGVGGDAPGSVPRGSCICAGPILSLGHPLSQAWGPQTAAVLWGFQVRCLGLLPRVQGLTGSTTWGSHPHSSGSRSESLPAAVAVPGDRAQGQKGPSPSCPLPCGHLPCSACSRSASLCGLRGNCSIHRF